MKSLLLAAVLGFMFTAAHAEVVIITVSHGSDSQTYSFNSADSSKFDRTVPTQYKLTSGDCSRFEGGLLPQTIFNGQRVSLNASALVEGMMLVSLDYSSTDTKPDGNVFKATGTCTIHYPEISEEKVSVSSALIKGKAPTLLFGSDKTKITGHIE